MKIFNEELIQKFSAESFQQQRPFPWFDFEQFLTPEAFKTLHEEFPSLELFEYHENIYRAGQRPHNRYYLAYEESVYHAPGAQPEAGVVRKQDLSSNWQQFMEELERGPLIARSFRKL